jgi:hypothetical protein
VQAKSEIEAGTNNRNANHDEKAILLEEFLSHPRPRQDKLLTKSSRDLSYISAQRMLRRITKSPVLKRVLCSRQNFSFDTDWRGLIGMQT